MQGVFLVWSGIGLLAVAAILITAARLAPNARLRRRLRKTRNRVVSKSKGPTVQLSVKPPKE